MASEWRIARVAKSRGRALEQRRREKRESQAMGPAGKRHAAGRRAVRAQFWSRPLARVIDRNVARQLSAGLE